MAMTELLHELDEFRLHLAKQLDPDAFEPVTHTHEICAQLRDKQARRNAAIASVNAIFVNVERIILAHLCQQKTEGKPN